MAYEGTPALVRRRQVAERVNEALRAHPAITAVLVTGSVALGQVDERSDVDLLVICRATRLPVEERALLLNQVGTDWHFHDQRQTNPLFPEGDTDGLVDGVLVTVSYQTVPWITEILDQVLHQGAITTTRVPFRPYTLPALLQRSLLLTDKEGIVARWRQEVAVFPIALKRNLLAHFAPVLQEYVEELVSGAERRLGPRHFLFFLDRAVDALINLLYALNDLYDPAERRAERCILPTLRRVPEGFIATLTDVLQGPFDDAGALYRAQRFQRLASQVLAMAGMSGQDVE